jgi:hypothetical protein
LWTSIVLGSAAFASDDATRNQLAKKDCVRGKFKDYYLQGQGGDPPASYRGRVFKLTCLIHDGDGNGVAEVA